MTNQNSPTGPVRRQRMAGYKPAQAEALAESETAAPAQPTQAAEVAPAETAAPAPAAPAPEAQPQPAQQPVRKQRMGVSASTPAASPPASAPAAALPTQQPVRKQRMGAPASAPPAPEVAAVAQPVAPAQSAAPAAEAAAPAPRPAPAPGPAPSSTAAAPPAQAPPGAAPTARPAWVRRAAITAGLLVLALVVVLAARWLRTLEPVQEFLATYNGHASQPDSAPVGLPAWLGWQHFFNMFFIVLIVRTGLQVRTERKPPGYWTAKRGSFFSPKGNTPRRVSLTQWLHQCLDVLWVLNGLVFVILLFTTGQWMRIVPTSWDIFPNMLSTGLQYASLDWPTENGWVHYNALQVMAYFSVVFLAAPLAILSGIRMSTWWPEKAAGLSKAYPVEWARAVHVPVMLYFVAFTVAHVFLVFFTGALRNLNHMFASRDAADWWGLVIFLGALAVTAAGWFLTRPLFMRPVADRMGKVSK